MSLKKYDRLQFQDFITHRVYNNSSWSDATTSLRFDGYNWIDLLPHPKFVEYERQCISSFSMTFVSPTKVNIQMTGSGTGSPYIIFYCPEIMIPKTIGSYLNVSVYSVGGSSGIQVSFAGVCPTYSIFSNPINIDPNNPLLCMDTATYIYSYSYADRYPAIKIATTGSGTDTKRLSIELSKFYMFSSIGYVFHPTF